MSDDDNDHDGMDDMGSDNSRDDGEVEIITDDSDANEEEN